MKSVKVLTCMKEPKIACIYMYLKHGMQIQKFSHILFSDYCIQQQNFKFLYTYGNFSIYIAIT